MKKVLVVGTSHSQAVCKNRDDRINRILLRDRWFDHLHEHWDVEILKLAKSGCSPEEQLISVYNYTKMNPDSYWDLAIIEGRSVQVGVSSPKRNIMGFPLNNDDRDDFDFEMGITPSPWPYYTWTDSWCQTYVDSGYSKHELRNFSYADRIDTHNCDGVNFQHKPYLRDWMIDYTNSYLHSIHVWSTNRAMCELLNKHSKHVTWFSFDCGDDLMDPHHPYNTMAHDFIGDYYLLDSQNTPHIHWEWDEKWGDWNDQKCDCGHLNEEGHRRLYMQHIYPNIVKHGYLD